MTKNLDFYRKISDILLKWYAINKRELPWRNTQNPYEIWVSEVILQQTKVAQGLPYYEKFIKNFSRLKHLVNSSEENVLKLWQGLGYYSRARNMHFTAKYIYNELNGKFPDNYKDLLKLKGIGDYTASAIASFAFGEVAPVLDGNVYRFISRLLGIETPINSSKSNKEFKEILFKIIDKSNPAEFNQAIMEFGSLQCIPKNPNCEKCVFLNQCFAYNTNSIKELPVKIKVKKTSTRYFTYYLVKNTRCFLLKKRDKKGIWENLYEFPMIESKDIFEKEIISKSLFSPSVLDNSQIKKVHGPYKHVLSHQNIYAKLIEIENFSSINELSFLKVEFRDFETYPIHRLMEKMVNNLYI